MRTLPLSGADSAPPPAMPEEQPHQRRLRFARIRRAKWLLRFVPRRARFHTYPLVGRFAAFARARNYLWSFRYPQIRPALYLGSVLTLIPLPVQLPGAFVLCLAFRANFMVMGGLQFLSNPATSVPLAIGTYKLGAMILNVTGISVTHPTITAPLDLDLFRSLPLTDADLLPESPAAQTGPEPASEVPDEKRKSWGDRIHDLFGDQMPPRGQPMMVQDWVRLLGHLFASFLIGATLAGLILGAVLDVLWRCLVLPAANLRASRKPVTALVTPHDNSPPPAL